LRRKRLKSEEIKRLAKKAGADLVGIASAERFSGAPKGHKPSDFLSNVKSVVVIGVHIPVSIVKSIPSYWYEDAYHHLNNKLRSIIYEVSFYLEDKGFDAFPVSPDEPDYVREVKALGNKTQPKVMMMASFSHRHAAVLAGLGEFSPASYVVVPKFGPRVRFASVITSAPLEPDKLLKNGLTWGLICKPNKCGLACIKACPAKALPGDGTIDQYKCRKYRGPKVYTYDYFKKIENLQMKKIPSHIIKILLPNNYRLPAEQICGVCLKACPIGVNHNYKT
jgi:epoxyqueuosine reductase QueG